MEDQAAVGGRRLRRQHEPHRLSEELCRSAYELVWSWARRSVPQQQQQVAASGENCPDESFARRA